MADRAVDPLTFGRYRVLGLLGRGGMGEVYRAHDSETDRVVALKVLPVRLSANEEYVARFKRECRTAARLNEAHVVPIHQFGEIEGRLYLDMRLVDGTDLAAWLRVHGPMQPAVAVAVVGQVAQALDAAHELGLVHRDVTPSNVLLAGVFGPTLDPATVFVYLFDFGIARPRSGAVGPEAAVLTRAGVVPGSPRYVAPERFAGVEGDPRADVYSLACVLHETLTGRPPFTGELPALMGAHLHKPPPRPSAVRAGVPAGFDDVVARGMAKEPGQRYPSAGELAAAARAVLGVSAEQSRVPATVASGVPPTAPTIVKPRRQAPLSDPARPEPGSHEPGPPDSEGVTMRFGPGTGTGATTGPAAVGWTPPRPPRRRWLRTVLSAGVTGLVVAAVLLYLWQNAPGGALRVEAVTVAPASPPGQACNTTVDVVGTLRTNGEAGVITYQWLRSDGETTDQLTQTVGRDASSANVHLLWRLSGSGHYRATATLQVTGPNQIQSEGTFDYDCH
ncbi:MAG TPA: serine/threonine-protein kinase [Pseudonocardia sp.]|nr:serine/threonine-protein kinase [Pseudonocardia sp.]